MIFSPSRARAMDGQDEWAVCREFDRNINQSNTGDYYHT